MKKIISAVVSIVFGQVCNQLQLDAKLIRDDSQKAYCWNRPAFQKWSNVNVAKRNVTLQLITDKEYYYQPNSGRYYSGQIFKPQTFMPVFIALNGNNVASEYLDQKSDIEFLVSGTASCIVRMQTFRAEQPVGLVDPCKLPPNSFKCIKWDEPTPEWTRKIHQCIPTEESSFPMEGYSSSPYPFAVHLVLKNKPGCIETPCFKLQSMRSISSSDIAEESTQTMIKYSKLRGEWRHVFRDQQKREIIARKADKRAIPCPFDVTEHEWIIDE